MKFLIVFAFTLVTASAFDLRGNLNKSRTSFAAVSASEGRITNGHEADEYGFRYQVRLTSKINADKALFCGGSLIEHRWVLTAAHCTHGAQSVSVYLGSIRRTSAEVKYTVSGSAIIIHSGYNAVTVKNDISLIQIPYTRYGTNIQPVKLPAIASFYSSYAGYSAIASGWGYTNDESTTLPIILQWARFSVITNYNCAETFLSNITDTNVCVSTYSGISSCDGDSGGPLVLAYSKIQIGLNSFGSDEGCTKGHPDVFTRVTSYLDWIQEHTGISN